MTTDTRQPPMVRGVLRSSSARQVAGTGLLLAALLAGRSDAAQSDILNGYVHASWTTEHGLPTSAITAITQDQHGYLWLASFAGLIRFDGERFVHWNAIGTPALPESLVHAVAASRDGSIWIGFGNLGGVGRLQGDALRVYTARDGLPEGSIQSLVEDRDGAVWAAGPGGVARFRAERWERVGSQRGIGRLFLGRDGTFYGVTSAGLLRRSLDTDAFDVLETPVRGVDVVEDASSAIWATGQGYLLRLLHSSTPAPQPRQGSALQVGRAQPASPAQADRGFNGYRLLKDRNGHLWIATLGQGLVYVRAENWATGSASVRITRQQGLTNDRVLSLFEDRESNIWVGTSVGLNRFTERTGADPLANRPELDGHNVLTVSTASDGAVWAGTANGVARFDASGSRWYSEREGLPGSSVRALHVDAAGTLWAATDGGPAMFSGGRFTRLPLPDNVRLNQISAITTDLEGGVWLFDALGAYRWTTESTTPVAFSPGPNRRRVSAALTDSMGRIWAGFAGGGVVVYDRGRIKSYSAGDGLSGDMVTAIHEGAGGTIWVGTIHALSKFEGNRFSTVTHADGLPGNRLTSIHGDQDGNLWIGTDFGFARIKPQEFDRAVRPPGPYRMSYRQIDASDGLEGIPTNRGYPNSARRADGTLWFVTSDGLTVVTPDAFRRAARPLPPLIERAYVDERPVAPANVELPAGTARLQVDYTSVTLSAAPEVRFRYMLEGNDTDWIDAGSRRQAFYTNLPPRDYRFRVAARIGDDEWVESENPWAFAIQPAIYQTTWFSVACGLALTAAAWGAWRVRLRQLRRQHALVVAERTRLAREIHDTLLQAMAGVALQLHRATELLESAPPARAICEKARDSLERYVRDARFAIWRLRSPELSESDLPGALRKVAEDLTAGSGAELAFNVVGPPARCAATVEDHLLRIGQEALLNAVRHAEATNVVVELHYEHGQVKLRVADNGCGFEPDNVKLRAHWGLAGMHERAALVGGSLTLTSARGQGTAVEATMPLAPREAGHASLAHHWRHTRSGIMSRPSESTDS